MNLSDADVGLLAGYMGHSDLIHHEHYRRTDSTLQATRLSKLLILFNSSKVNDYAGRTLEQVSENEIDSQDIPTTISEPGPSGLCQQLSDLPQDDYVTPTTESADSEPGPSGLCQQLAASASPHDDYTGCGAGNKKYC